MRRERRFWERVKRAGPRVKVDLLAVVEFAETVMELADGECRVVRLQTAVQFRQRAVAGAVPVRKFGSEIGASPGARRSRPRTRPRTVR